MERLSKKNYWNNLYDINGFNKYNRLKYFFSYSLQNYEYFNIIKKHCNLKYLNIIEIGCAPGTYLIKAHKFLGLTPFGVDYSSQGTVLTKLNLKENKIPDFKIYCSDVFDKNFQKKFAKHFDVTFSNGFVEHFSDFKKTLECHINITKIEGLIVISIPNLLYFNKYFSIKEVNDICNLAVMDLNFIKSNLPSSVELKYLNYYGGFFNIGVFFFKNKYLEFFRKIFFVGQRIFLEPIGILLYKLGIKFNWKYSSPAIILVCERKK